METEEEPLEIALKDTISIQKVLSDLMPGKGEEIFRKLHFTSENTQYKEIVNYAREYVYLLKIRPYCLEDIINLCIWTAFTPSYGDKFVCALFDQLIYQESYYLLRKLVQRGLFSIEAVIEAIKNNDYCDIVLYFADMINIDDYIKNDYDYISTKYLQHYAIIMELRQQESPDLAGFYDTLWKKDELPVFLKTDDVNGLSDAISNMTQFGAQLPWSPFEYYPKPKQTTLICLAALFGAVKCFKLLLSKRSVITQSVAEAAIIGGNKDIWLEVKKKNEDLKSLVVTIYNYQRNDLMELIPNYPNPPFKLLADFRNYDAISISLGGGISINTPYNNRLETPLHYVAQQGDFEKLVLFSQSKGDLKAISKTKYSAILYAALSGNVRCVEFLVMKNCKTFDSNFFGWNLAHCAAESGSVKMVKYVESLLPNFYTVLDKSGWNAFLHAVQSGSIPLIKYMITEKQQDINFKTNKDINALYISFSAKNVEVSKWLINNGFKLTNEQRDGLLNQEATPELKALLQPIKENQ